MTSRRIERIERIDGVEYVLEREAPVRDGGSVGTSGTPWFVSVVDPVHGCCLDERVPEGHHRTMRAAREALRAHVARRTEPTNGGAP
jgi:hypothetical protein